MKETNEKVQISFGEVASKWLKEKEKQVSLDTYMYYDRMIHNVVLQEILDEPIEDVKKQSFLEAIERKLNEMYVKSSTSNYLRIVKTVIAYYDGEIKQIGACPKKTVTEELLEEMPQIIKLVNDKEYCNDVRKIGVGVILYTGLKVSELVTLKWKNIDFSAKIIKVYETATRKIDIVSGKTQVVISKMDNPRVVPVNKELEKILKKYYKGSDYENTYILSNTERICEPRNFQLYIEKFCGELNRGYSTTDFRDMFFVRSLECEVNLITLADITGVDICHLYKRFKKLIDANCIDNAIEIKKLKY